MMEITFTCPECGSGVHVYPTKDASVASCGVCSTEIKTTFTDEHYEGVLKDCPCCQRKDFYSQKDFSRKIGVSLFVIAAILSIWTYGISFIVLYLFDLLLFQKLKPLAICYKCQTIFRKVKNIEDILGYNHEMNDRIVYSDHDFQGKPLEP